MTNRNKWSTDELKVVQSLFGDFLKRGKTRGSADVQNCIAISKHDGGFIWKLKPDNNYLCSFSHETFFLILPCLHANRGHHL